MSGRISKYQMLSDEQRRLKIEYQKAYNKRISAKKDLKAYHKKYYENNKSKFKIQKELCICGGMVVNMKGHLNTKLHKNKIETITCILIDMKNAKV